MTQTTAAIVTRIKRDQQSARMYRALAAMCRTISGQDKRKPFWWEQSARSFDRRAARVETGWGEPK